MKVRRGPYLSLTEHGPYQSADKLLRDATRSWRERELELERRIAELERQNRIMSHEIEQRDRSNGRRLPEEIRPTPPSGNPFKLGRMGRRVPRET